MTVIAYDGKTVAADKQTTNHGWGFKTTKLHRFENKVLCFCGDAGLGLALMNWFKSGCKADDFPKMDEDTQATLLVFERGKPVVAYEGTPYPYVTDMTDQFAAGSGRDFALGAMSFGATAIQAVQVANKLSAYCGEGFDAVCFEDDAGAS